MKEATVNKGVSTTKSLIDPLHARQKNFPNHRTRGSFRIIVLIRIQCFHLDRASDLENPSFFLIKKAQGSVFSPWKVITGRKL